MGFYWQLEIMLPVFKPIRFIKDINLEKYSFGAFDSMFDEK